MKKKKNRQNWLKFGVIAIECTHHWCNPCCHPCYQGNRACVALSSCLTIDLNHCHQTLDAYDQWHPIKMDPFADRSFVDFDVLQNPTMKIEIKIYGFISEHSSMEEEKKNRNRERERTGKNNNRQTPPIILTWSNDTISCWRCLYESTSRFSWWILILNIFGFISTLDALRVVARWNCSAAHI